MENPSAESLTEMVRKLNQMVKGTKSREPDVDDFLRAIASDPMARWFTELLREKNEELASERQRAHQLAGALRAWYQAKHSTTGSKSGDEAELQLINVLRGLEVLDL